jgi:Ca-activated chloride channel family protein
MIGDQPWIVTLPLAQAAAGSGVSKLWARRKIADAEVARVMRSIAPDEADRRILALALEHHLVTRLTSLVAVDRTPSRPEGVRLTRADVPLNLPAGWDFDKVFGPARDTPTERAPTPVERRADLTDAAKGKRATDATRPRIAQLAAAPVQHGVPLPRTATDAELRLWLGLMLCVACLVLMMVRRRALASG